MFKFADRDLGMDCDFEVMGETKEEVMKKAFAHAKKEHSDMFMSMNPEQMTKMEKQLESLIKKVK